MKKGFTIIELLVVIAIIALLGAVIYAALGGSSAKARDVRREADLAQVGQLLTISCYTPDAGAGDYDIADFIDEMRAKYPQYSSQLSNIPHDPKGSEGETRYRYTVTAGNTCALYANLEEEDIPTTLTGVSSPTPGAGKGVFASPSIGVNGSHKYFQVSN